MCLVHGVDSIQPECSWAKTKQLGAKLTRHIDTNLFGDLPLFLFPGCCKLFTFLVARAEGDCIINLIMIITIQYIMLALAGEWYRQ